MSEREKPQLALNNENNEAAIKKALETFAVVRTAFSAERAVLAWMRTSVSFYTFGFSITKFMDYLEQRQEGIQFSDGPRLLGVILICVGILSLVLAVIQHVRRIRRAKELGLPTISRFSLPTSAAVALLAIGITSLIAIALHWLL